MGASVFRGRGRGPQPGYDAPLSNAEQGGEPRRRERAWEIHERRQDEQDKVFLHLFEQMVASLGGIFNVLTNPPIDDVLFAGSVVIGTAAAAANAVRTFNFKQPSAYVAIFNYSTQAIWIIEGTFEGGHAPGPGPGRFQIQAGESRGVPLRGGAVSLFIAASPAPAPACDLAIYARPARAFGGVI